MTKEKYTNFYLKFENRVKLLDKGRTKILGILLKEFLKDVENGEVEISCKITNKEVKFIAYRTLIDVEVVGRLKELAKNNGVTMNSIINFVIEKYL